MRRPSPCFKKSLEVLKKSPTPNDWAEASALNNLAQLYRVLARYSLAEPLYRRALALQEKTFGPDHPEVALTPEQPGGAILRPEPTFSC